MKRLKITSVLLSATMCLSMITTPVGVWADETPEQSETQTAETTETKESSETKAPEGTEKPETETTKETESAPETEPAETAPESSESEKDSPSASVPAKNDNNVPEESEPLPPDETAPSEPGNGDNPGNGNNTDPGNNGGNLTSGTCGEHLTWYIDSTYSSLYIEGYGDMYDYSYQSRAPWNGINFFAYVHFSNDVTSIGNYAFYESQITAIYIANTKIKRIGSYAFSKCWGNRIIELPQGLTTIGNKAFEDSQFETIYIPSSITSIGEYAFNECFYLKEITIPGSIKTISDNLFKSCFRLEEVTFLNGVTTINATFKDCNYLKKVTIPKSVTTIKSGVFNLDYAPKDIYYGGTETDWQQISIGTNNVGLNSEKIHFASYAAFGEYENLSWTLDNNGVLTITGSGDMADSTSGPNWRAAKDSIKSVVLNGNITSISSGAFEGCTNLTSITIPDSVSKIGAIAFFECTNLKNIKIPDTVTSIGDSCFSGCPSITSLTLPKNITTIESRTFYGCFGLTGLVIPDGVAQICDNAFESCVGLKSITIPKSVTIIGSCILNGCYETNDIYYKGTKDDWNNITVDADNEELFKATIHLSDGTVIEGKKPDNTLKVTGGKTAKIKYKKLRKKARTVSRSKVMTISAPKGTVTYKLVSVKKSKYKKYFKINATTGTVTVKKKLRRGTYTVKCSVTASGTKDFKSKTQTVSFKIKVK